MASEVFLAQSLHDPDLFKIPQIRGGLLGVARKIERETLQQYYKTTATWNHKVKFDSTFSFSGGNVQILVYTEDLQYNGVDEGTRVRYATMTDDFVPKTYPGVIGSFPGRGGVKFVNRNIPRPGIEARGFSREIRNLMSAKLYIEIRDSVQRNTP